MEKKIRQYLTDLIRNSRLIRKFKVESLKSYLNFSWLQICILGITWILSPSFSANAQRFEQERNRPKVAVVLSGGGAKGFAHIGVLKVLEQEGVPIDIIVGTSMGSLIGGFYSLGYSAEEIEEIVKKQDWEKVLSDNVSRNMLSKRDQLLAQRYLLSFSFSDVKSVGLPQGIIKGQNVLNIFCGLAGNVPADVDFSTFSISFACVAANLETGEEVVLKDGFFPTALFASMAIPGAFRPINRNNLLLVDGGVVNNFPTDVAKKMGADIIIGVDIRGDLLHRDKLQSLDGVFSQMVNFLGQEKDSINRDLCNIFIRPDIKGYSVTSFTQEAADTLILRGEKAALQLKEQIEALKKEYGLKKRSYSRELVVKDKWLISDIKFNGDYRLDKTFLKNKLGLELPGEYSHEQIKHAIDRLYGYGGFDLIYYFLSDNSEGKTLNLNITPQKEYSQQIGFKVNTYDAAAVMLNFTKKNFQKSFSFLSSSLELSANPGAGIVAETFKKDLPTFGIELKAKYQKYNIYDKGDKLYNADLFYTTAKLYLYKSIVNKLIFGVGIQEEYFNGDVFTKNPNSSLLSLKTDRFLSSAYSYISYDNMDDFYFPTRGTRLDIEFAANVEFSGNNTFSPSLLLKMNRVIPVSHKTAILFNVYHRSLFNDNYPRIKTTLIGGEPCSQYFNHHLPFVGLPPVIVAERFSNIALVGARIQVHKNQYVSFMYNLMVQSDNFKDTDNIETIGGGGIKYSMNTIIGPIDIGVGYTEKYDKPAFSANFGFWF